MLAGRRWSMRKTVLAAVLLASGGAGAESWDASIRRLCVSTAQQDCWIKAGTPLCAQVGRDCRELPDATPARVIAKSGRYWQVETRMGSGYVPERLMLIDSSK
jgi:hypothetical protein